MSGSDSSAGSAAVRSAADLLVRAAAEARPVPPVRDLLPATDLATGYAVQRLVTEGALGDGRRIVGRKIGLTSLAVQRQLGVDTPDIGVLFEDMRCDAGRPVSTSRLLQPRIETEIAFVLGRDLVGDTSVEAVRAATESVVASFEIVDSRIAGWDITLVDTVADNASSGLFVLGEDPIELGELDLRPLSMTMTDASGTVVSSGVGSDCLGDPVRAVAWLAAAMADFGEHLRAGDVILSGALGPMVPVAPGAAFHAVIDGIGTVDVRFDGSQGGGAA